MTILRGQAASESLSSTALHDAHASAHVHSATTATATAHGGFGAIEAASSGSLLLLTCWVTDGLVDGEDSAGGLTGGSQHVKTDELGLPDKLLKHVVGLVLKNVDTLPQVLGVVLHMELS